MVGYAIFNSIMLSIPLQLVMIIFSDLVLSCGGEKRCRCSIGLCVSRTQTPCGMRAEVIGQTLNLHRDLLRVAVCQIWVNFLFCIIER